MEETIVNRVANSSLISLDLEDFYPKGEKVVFDIAPLLFEGLILKEKDFRNFIKENDWSLYTGKNIALICSEDAIVPTWAYMLLVTKLEPLANIVVFGDIDKLEQSIWQKIISEIDFSTYQKAKVVVKGCSKHPVPVFAYVEVMNQLMKVADSIAFGEPCSTVPLFKRKV